VTGDHGLTTISVTRADGSVHSSLVNGGLIDHPVSGERVAAVVVRGDSFKLKRMRKTGRCTLLFRVGWDWASIEGPVDIIGPNDDVDAVDPADVPKILRDVFTAAGGTHDDWDEYDRTAVFVSPARVHSRASTR